MLGGSRLRKWVVYVSLLVVALVLTGCLGGGGTKGQPLAIQVSASSTKVDPGESVTLTANVLGTGASNAQIQWADGGAGVFSVPTGKQVEWTAPTTTGTYEIMATATAGSRSVTGSVKIQVVKGDGGGGNGGSAALNVGSFYRPGAKWEYVSQLPDPDSDIGTLTMTKTVEVRQEGTSLVFYKTLDITDASGVTRITGWGKEYIEVESDKLLVHKTELRMQYPHGFEMAFRSVFEPLPGQKLTAFVKGRTFTAQWQENRTHEIFGVDVTYPVDVSLQMEILDIVPESITTEAGHFPNALRVEYWVALTETDEDGTTVKHMDLVEWYDPVVGLLRTTETLDQYGLDDGWQDEAIVELKRYVLP